MSEPGARGDQSTAEADGDRRLVDLYRRMLLVRVFEEAAQRAFRKDKIGGYLHLYSGQEAVAAGFLSAFREGDQVITGYRDHAHALLLGCGPGEVMAELYGRTDGVAKGKGGSMHLFDVERGLLGGYGIVGGHVPLGVGCAYALAHRETGGICQLYIGDGAIQNGVFHESANLAALWGRDHGCPVVFIVENNLYGIGTSVDRATAMTDLAAKFDAYGIESEKVDGMDVEAVMDCAERVTEHVRETGSPYAVEAQTYRLAPHGAADAGDYRSEEEVEEWRERDPLSLLERRLADEDLIGSDELDELKSEVEEEVERAGAFAEDSDEPPEDELYTDVYAGDDEYTGRR